MSNFTDSLQHKIKTSSAGLATFVLKVISGFVLGLTLALIGEQAIGYGNISFLFVILITTLVFVKITKPWAVVPVLVFDLVMILIGLLLRMYILVAPGA